MVSPSPLPVVESFWLPLWNGLRILASVAGDMPGPVSVTLKVRRIVLGTRSNEEGVPLQRIFTATVPPSGVYWTALLAKLPLGGNKKG